jgi:hypothetical protein
MSRLCKSSLVLALTIACLSGMTALASANRLSVSSTTLRAVWPEWTVTARWGETVLFQSVCALTLHATLHTASFAKVSGSLLARADPATLAPTCRTGSPILLTERLPWHLRYASFSGTLPNMSSVAFDIVGVSFLWREPLGARCLYGGTEASPARFSATLERGGVTSVRWDETRPVPGGGEGGLCPSTVTYSGSGTMMTINSTTRITVTLI